MAKSYFMLCQHDMQEQCMPYYLMYYLRYFCLLAHSGVQHILSCFLLCFFSSCVPYVPVSLDCPLFYCHFGIL